MSTAQTRCSSKKRGASTQEPATGTNDDHRKRRRNRTTQSCVQCHHSKRMCDRKRPCGRCTQLGLTGLCVYEVDDPSQVNETADDKARLQKRVAELESVIRELKNKPHPRWAPITPNPSADVVSRPDSTPTSPLSSEQSSIDYSKPVSSTTLTCSTSLLAQASKLDMECLIHHSPSPSASPEVESDRYFSSYPSGSDAYSPSSSGAPLTPSLDPIISSMLSPPPLINDESSFASLFSCFHELTGFEDQSFAKLLDDTARDVGDIQTRHTSSSRYYYGSETSQCGCLAHVAIYNVVLELSLRLRKAAETLVRHPAHTHGSACILQQRITELDAFTNLTLGNVDTPTDLDGASSGPGPRRPSAPSRQFQPQASPSNVALADHAWTSIPSHLLTISPTTLHRTAACSNASMNHPTSYNDSFMSWEPHRQHDWSMRSIEPS